MKIIKILTVATLIAASLANAKWQALLTPVGVAIGDAGNRENKYILHATDEVTKSNYFIVLGPVSEEIAHSRFVLALTSLSQGKKIFVLYWDDTSLVPTTKQDVWKDNYQQITTLKMTNESVQ